MSDLFNNGATPIYGFSYLRAPKDIKNWAMARLPKTLEREVIDRTNDAFKSFIFDDDKMVKYGLYDESEDVTISFKPVEEGRINLFRYICMEIASNKAIVHRDANSYKWRYYIQSGYHTLVVSERPNYVYNAIEDISVFTYEEYLRLILPGVSIEDWKKDVVKYTSMLNNKFTAPHWKFDEKSMSFVEISGSREKNFSSRADDIMYNSAPAKKPEMRVKGEAVKSGYAMIKDRGYVISMDDDNLIFKESLRKKDRGREPVTFSIPLSKYNELTTKQLYKTLLNMAPPSERETYDKEKQVHDLKEALDFMKPAPNADKSHDVIVDTPVSTEPERTDIDLSNYKVYVDEGSRCVIGCVAGRVEKYRLVTYDERIIQREISTEITKDDAIKIVNGDEELALNIKYDMHRSWTYTQGNSLNRNKRGTIR